MNQTIDLNISKKSAKAGDSIPHESAHLHVTGQATYIDDLPELENTMHLAVDFQIVPKAKSVSLIWMQYVKLMVSMQFSAKDIEVENNWGQLLKMIQFLPRNRLSFMDKPCLWLWPRVISKPVRQFA